MDLRGARLIDSVISLTVRGRCLCCEAPSVKTMTGVSRYHELLIKYLDLMEIDGTCALIQDKICKIKGCL